MKTMLRIGITKKIFPRPIFEKIVAKRLKGKKLRRVMQAYRLAKYGHRNQQRRDLSRYFDHCKSGALIVMLEFGIYDSDMLVVMLLHDSREDTFIFENGDLADFFGKHIEHSINLLTKRDYSTYHAQLATGSWKDLVCKFADRIHNLRSLPGTPDEFIIKQVKETVTIYFPLLTVLESKIPKRYQWLLNYIRHEMLFACYRAEQSLKTS
jgi:(p)ppGpp synthase/HD superfamily hydrolase